MAFERTRTVGKLWRYLRDPGVAAWRKLAGAAAVAYVIWPLDVIPDGIPVLGWLDDAGILAAAAAFLVVEVRRHQRRLERASEKTVDAS
ncbi:MAG TPA: YkvA family protein [Myxococcaceae bacterium]|nr:YkvA family protein [Myxococcaceae bacterium]